MTLEGLAEVCRVLTKLWGDDAPIAIDYARGVLRIKRGAGQAH
jgi:hypothetical protein